MKMRIVGGVVIAVLLSANVASRADLSWVYAANLLDWDEDIEAGWLVQMYHDVNADTVVGDIHSFDWDGSPLGGDSSDDILLAEFTTVTAEGKGDPTPIEFGTAFTPAEWSFLQDENVYTVLFSASSIQPGQQAVILDANSHTLPSSDPATYSLDSVNNDWVAVIPEPGTMGLFGLGVVGLMAYRRRRHRG